MPKPTIEDLQRQITALQAERGVPADAVAAYHMALKDHVAARKAGRPSVDYSALEDVLSVERPSKLDAEKIRVALDDHYESNPQHRHEDAYLRQLGRDLHRSTLDEESASQAAAQQAVDDEGEE